MLNAIKCGHSAALLNEAEPAAASSMLLLLNLNMKFIVKWPWTMLNLLKRSHSIIEEIRERL